jgi:cysteinyl-tRNA synthetase
MSQSPSPLRLFNSLTRQLEPFEPIKAGEARVYTCGPTVYNYQHIGNMRAYVFADTLGRVLSYKGYDLKHVINITDVGHLTSDADAGDDKMEKAASAQGKTAKQSFIRPILRLISRGSTFASLTIRARPIMSPR